MLVCPTAWHVLVQYSSSVLHLGSVGHEQVSPPSNEQQPLDGDGEGGGEDSQKSHASLAPSIDEQSQQSTPHLSQSPSWHPGRRKAWAQIWLVTVVFISCEDTRMER